jgi:ribosome biogenesis GTPase
VDSPGIRDFVPTIDDVSKIQLGYTEIVGRADQCRFADCEHTREPNCAVRSAVDSGDISERRYESYKRLLNLSKQRIERMERNRP